jgi:hypothetical protein
MVIPVQLPSLCRCGHYSSVSAVVKYSVFHDSFANIALRALAYSSEFTVYSKYLGFMWIGRCCL